MGIVGVTGTRYTKGERDRNRMADKGFGEILAESLAAGLGGGVGAAVPNFLLDLATGQRAHRAAETKGVEARTEGTAQDTIAQELANARTRVGLPTAQQMDVAINRLGRDKAIAERGLLQPQTELERAKIASSMGDLRSYDSQRGLRDAATVGRLQAQAAAFALDLLLHGGEPSPALYNAMGAGYPSDVLESVKGMLGQMAPEAAAADIDLTRANTDFIRRRIQGIGEDVELARLKFEMRLRAMRARNAAAKAAAQAADPADAFIKYVGGAKSREMDIGGEVSVGLDPVAVSMADAMFTNVVDAVADAEALGKPVPKKHLSLLKTFGTKTPEGWVLNEKKLSGASIKKTTSPDAVARIEAEQARRDQIQAAEDARSKALIDTMKELAPAFMGGDKVGDIGPTE